MTHPPRRTRAAVLLVVALALALAGCAADTGSGWTYAPATSAPAASPGASPGGSPAGSPGASPGDPLPSGTGSPPDAIAVVVGTDTGTDLEFDPDSVSVPADDEISLRFENRATVPHNLTFQEGIDAATATVVDPGASEEVKFSAPDPGSYQFVCTLHPGMEGTLEVE